MTKLLISLIIFAVSAAGQLANQVSPSLSSAFQRASLSNPVINPPWTLVSPWAISTAYVINSVVSNSGHLYVEDISSCTSASSGSGPTQVTSVNTADNTCYWLYFGEQAISANDANAPSTSTASGSSPFGAAGTSVLYYPALYPSYYTVFGATPTVYSTNYWNFQTFNNRSGNNISAGYLVCSEINDSKFAVGFTSGTQPAAVIIDNRYYSEQVSLITSGTPNWVIFDFSAATGFRKHSVCVQAGKAGFTYAGISVTPKGSVSAAGTAGDVALAMIYDSYDGGSTYGPFSAYGLLGTQVAWRMGWRVTHMSQGGTGLQNNGSANAACSAFSPNYCYTYIQRAQDTTNAAILATQRVIMFNVSSNDAGLSGESTAVTALYTQLRSTNPTALIIGVGPASINASGASYSQMQALDTAGASGFAAFTDPASNSCYIPVTNDTVPWITGSYESGIPTNASNTTSLINTGDNIHPTDLGTGYLAARIASAIATKCIGLN